MSAKSTENAAASGAIPSDESCRCFSLSEILTTTNNFDDDSVIGIGGFGKVYKGSIDNGTITVAIKRLKDESEQGAKEFWMEVKMLSKLRHTHLVTLIGYCNEREEMILVYEYIANGTLENHLYKTSRKESGMCIPPLMWEQRLQICVDSARGLDYLHTGTHQRVIHRDVKTTNILLDEELVAKISDFGLSKSMTSQSMTHVSTKFKGTWGYLDPECFYIHKPTIKSDVYAFGVVLLEVLCGRPPVDVNLEEEQISLVLWAQHCIKKGKLDRIIDPFLIGQISPQCLKLFVEVANNCLHKSSKPRPTMAEVVGRLEFILALQCKGKTEGIVTKMFKGMNQWWSWEGKYNNSKSESENKVQMGGDELPAYIGGRNEQPKEDFNSAVEEAEKNKLVFFKGSLQNFDLEDLFLPSAEVMGKRNYGTTYKAVLEDGTTVIVKRLKDVVVGKREFVQQMEMVGRVGQHPNVVPLRAYYCFKDEKFMIYDYMVVGSLSALLHGSRKTGKVLDWESRVKVCLGAARGLAHIHSANGRKFAHGNIKSSNVLLTLNLHGCISDFGLTTLMGFPAVSLGSAGYRDPKVIETTKTTQTSDVYSFGVLLLEMLTGKSPVHTTGHDDVVDLPRWVQSVVREEWTAEVFDIELMKYQNIEEKMVQMLQIAMDCVKYESYSRPKMDEVVKMIEEILPDDSDNKPSSEDNKSRSPTTQTP